MALGFVFLQQRLYLKPQRAVIQGQPLADVLMYGRFADPEFFGGSAYCRLVLYQVKGQLFGPLFQIFFDSAPLLQAVPLYVPFAAKRTGKPCFYGRFRIINIYLILILLGKTSGAA